jgi:diguanylate cyclase (GGDEF)-like protein
LIAPWRAISEWVRNRPSRVLTGFDRSSDAQSTNRIDGLTGVRGRGALIDRIQRYAALPSASEDGRFALICLDLDNLKNINGTLGYTAGDAVLVSTAQRLSALMRDHECLYRIDGDKFIAFVGSQTKAQVLQRSTDLLDALRGAHRVEGYDLLLTASIGVVQAPKHGRDARTLLQSADIAVDAAKSLGRNNVVRFDRGMRAALERRVRLTQALRRALTDGAGLYLVFQPKFSANDSVMRGAEALLRWRHPELGEVSPGEFVPLAEQAGLAYTLDACVFGRVARQLATWAALGATPRICVNLSALTLVVRDAADQLLAIINREGADPRQLDVEVTEHEDIGASAAVTANLQRFRAAGVGIALDDFGTGHSSLRYVQALPLTALKIDRCFITNIDRSDHKSVSILRASIALARELGLLIVAEGVETPSQREWLGRHGCDLLQGFLLERPLDADTFTTRYLSAASG